MGSKSGWGRMKLNRNQNGRQLSSKQRFTAGGCEMIDDVTFEGVKRINAKREWQTCIIHFASLIVFERSSCEKTYQRSMWFANLVPRSEYFFYVKCLRFDGAVTGRIQNMNMTTGKRCGPKTKEIKGQHNIGIIE